MGIQEILNLLNKIHRGTYRETVETSAILLVPQQANRVGLVISSPQTNSIRLGMSNNISTTTGMRLAAGQNPLVLTHELFGNMVKGPIWAIAEAGSESIDWWDSSAT